MHTILRTTRFLNGRYNFAKCCDQHSLPMKYSSCTDLCSIQETSRLLVNCSKYNGFSNIRKCSICYIPLSGSSRHNVFIIRNFSLPHSYTQEPDRYSLNFQATRSLSLSSPHFEKEPLKPSSKVEVTVQELKKKKEDAHTEVVPKAPVKKSLSQKIIHELVHYYHGFRLLFIDMKISMFLVWRILNGKSLSRREHRLLIRTVGDMFRLVPFSVFIIVPFMELLLPLFIKFFPGMLPSTFQTATEKEDKLKQNLKVKLEMAKFLQETLDDMAVQHDDHNSQLAKEFSEWFTKVRTSGEQVSNEDIMKFSKLFEDEITLDSLTRSQLVALCRVLEVQTLGTNNILRFQLRMKLRSLAADDKMIQKEGVDSLSLSEVQQACRARGMRAYGVSEQRLRTQLKQWLDLSLNEKVPPSLLLLSRALMLPETIPTSDKLKATISSLPETIVTQTKAAIGEKEGKIDNKVKLQVMREEERRMKEERREMNEQKQKEEKIKDKEVLVDKAPTVDASATPEFKEVITETVSDKTGKEVKEEQLHAKDVEALEDALDEISKVKHFIVEKEEIEELKEQMADYQEDVQDLEKAVAQQPQREVKETKAAQRLFKRVNKMIGKMDGVLGQLVQKEEQLKKDIDQEPTDKKKEELLHIDDIMAAIKKIKDVPDDDRLAQIKNVLGKIDDDHDGSIKVEDVLKVLEFIGKEQVNLSAKQLDELIELIDKEEILEVEDKIERALQKNKETKDAEKPKETVQAKSDKGGKGDGEGGEGGSGGGKIEEVVDEKKKEEVNEKEPVAKPKIDTKANIITPPPNVDTKTSHDSKVL